MRHADRYTDRCSPAAIACPNCGHIGSPVQLTPDRPGRIISSPVYLCGGCDHSFSAEVDSSIHPPDPVSQEIRDCLREDSERGVRRGGGSKVKRAPKPGDKLLSGYRAEQAPGPGNTAATTERSSSLVTIETKRIVRTFRLTPTEDAAIWSVANARGLTLAQAFQDAMGDWLEKWLVQS